LDALFKECHRVGEKMVSEGLITRKDIEEARSGKGSRVISIGLPAYCLVQGLLRSAKFNSMGILISKWNPSSRSCYFPLTPFLLFFSFLPSKTYTLLAPFSF